MPESAWELLVADAPLLARLLEPTPVAHAIALLAELFGSVDSMRSAARFSLSEVPRDRVRSARSLGALASIDPVPVEILRANLALAAPSFEQFHRSTLALHGARVLGAVNERLAALPPRIASLLGDQVELSTTLGARGRGFDDRVVVGNDALPGQPIDPDPTLVLALHERIVQRASERLAGAASEARWEDVEAVALQVERRVLRDTSLEAAHSRWLHALDLDGLSDPTLAPLSTLVDVITRDLDVEGAE